MGTDIMVGSEIVSAKVLGPAFTKIATSIAEASKGPLARIKDEWKVRLEIGFEAYLKQQITKYSHVKTIIGSAVPVRFDSLYVNSHVKIENRRIRDDDIMTKSADFRRCIFIATAGAGKSMLMRYIFFQSINECRSRLPVFIELRDLNESNDQSLIEVAAARIGEYVPGFTVEQLRFAFQQGMVALFLDGLDEIDHDKRKKRGREINNLAGRYDDLTIYVSSRPDEGVSSWQRFHVLHLDNFTETQVRNLIAKIPYEESIKAIFFKKLDLGLYKTHNEFLTNPLLTIMMLITLEQFADVPAKIHLFYEYAFEALFARHDVTKNGFQRKRHVTLALDDYRRLFSYFCTLTYLREIFRFSHSSALEYIDKSVSSSQIEIKKDDFLEDLTGCTCMLVRDGLEYAFSHRSFQEYFVAYFFARIKPDELARAAPRLLERGRSDNVLFLVAEMNKENFEADWALPQIERLCDAFREIEPESDVTDFFKVLFGNTTLSINKTGSITVLVHSDKELGSIRYLIYRVYDVFERINKRIQFKKDGDKEIVSKLISGEILPKDKRFSDWRKNNDDTSRVNIKLLDVDNDWLRQSYYGKFYAIEREELFILRDELRTRVCKRQEGLAAILDL